MSHCVRPTALAAVLLLGVAMSEGCRPHVTAAPPLHAEVDDPAGDARAIPDVAIAPDLVHATADVAGGTMTFAVRFAPGSFDRGSTRLTIQLDTDQNPSTGIRTPYGLGIDYIVDLWAPARRAVIQRTAPGAPEAVGACNPCYVEVGAARLTIAADGMSTTLPLSRIETAQGRFAFRVLAYAMRPGTTPTLPTAVSDFMPDVGLAPGRIQ